LVSSVIESNLTQGSLPASAPASLRQRLALLAINALVFEALYAACNLAAARAGVTRDIASAWDAAVPFVAWMLVPYMSSAPLLVAGFALTPTRQSLRALSQRCLLATAIGTLVFALWPLRVGFPAPASTASALAPLGALLRQLDAPYNQWPSLHVAYCVILWPALRGAMPNALARAALAGWLLLVAASTVFTHQHYLGDVAGGALLGALAWRAVPAQRDVAWVSLHYAVAALAAITLGLTVLPWLPCLWLAASCAGVAWAYAQANADFLHKRGGGFPAWVRVLHAPYLLGYRITWRLVRWRERRRPAFEAFAPRVWIGRRLDDREAAALPPDCAVIDLAAELSGTPSLRHRPGQAFGLLDIVPPAPERLARIADAIDAQLAAGRCVYVHCAMGYRRSREAALAWQARHPGTPIP
jgi:membrane-associated phospholipid phosphatase